MQRGRKFLENFQNFRKLSRIFRNFWQILESSGNLPLNSRDLPLCVWAINNLNIQWGQKVRPHENLQFLPQLKIEFWFIIKHKRCFLEHKFKKEVFSQAVSLWNPLYVLCAIHCFTQIVTLLIYCVKNVLNKNRSIFTSGLTLKPVMSCDVQ